MACPLCSSVCSSVACQSCSLLVTTGTFAQKQVTNLYPVISQGTASLIPLDFSPLCSIIDTPLLSQHVSLSLFPIISLAKVKEEICSGAVLVKGSLICGALAAHFEKTITDGFLFGVGGNHKYCTSEWYLGFSVL